MEVLTDLLGEERAFPLLPPHLRDQLRRVPPTRDGLITGVYFGKSYTDCGISEGAVASLAPVQARERLDSDHVQP